MKAMKPILFPVVREYIIGETRYIVKAAVKDGATESAAAKVRRLIRKEVTRQNDKK
ncbi:hypothetical protein FACS1894217_13120 [Clostridia bacterium]|nr:hypothetical protein FACS1894202_09670 [Clostridia bacterium]GHV09257.1 hypothetical protein FACS1894217_13120 [Clostridia bacterium]